MARRNRSVAWLMALSASWGLSACTGSGSGSTEAPLATRLLVVPANFLGDVPCDPDADGALRSYQVTLYDVTAGSGDEAFALPSSSVVSCDQSISFTYVVPGHLYTAAIRAFDQTELRAKAPGFPQAVDATGAAVEPRWTTTCYGTSEALADQGMGGMGGLPEVDAAAGAGGASSTLGIRAVQYAEVAVRGCAPLLDSGTPTETGASVDLAQSLLDTACGSAEGEVERFTARVISPAGLGATASAACGERVVLQPLPAQIEVSIEVEVDVVGAAEPAVLHCQARTARGAVVPATCEPLPLTR